MSTTLIREERPASGDDLLGVCRAIGEAFGFDPLWLRVPLIASVLISFEGALAVYATLGLALLIGRLGGRVRRA